MALFAMCSTEDGVYMCEVRDFEQFIKDHSEGYRDYYKPKFLSKIPDDWSMVESNHWLLIEGVIKVPKPVKVVEKYEL